jgi:hypothetical protein
MQHPKLLFGSALLLIALSVSGVIIWQTPGAQTALANAKITAQAEPFSELYFNDHQHLPSQAVAGEFSFTASVVNRERVAKAYPYRVTLTVDGATTTLDQGTFNLAVGHSHIITQKYVLKGLPTSAEISVQLVGENQEIHFWMRKK